MNKILTRLLMVFMLMAFSMGVQAQVKVFYGPNGNDSFKGGKVAATKQETKGDQVVVTLTVTPDQGYIITRDDIKVYETISPSTTRAEDGSVQLGKELTIDGPDGKVTKATDYTVTVSSNLGLWVREANFQLSGSKNEGELVVDPGYSGFYYIANNDGYKSADIANNYYLCPASDNLVYNTDQPYLTTYKTGQVSGSIWEIRRADVEGEYYLPTPPENEAGRWGSGST